AFGASSTRCQSVEATQPVKGRRSAALDAMLGGALGYLETCGMVREVQVRTGAAVGAAGVMAWEAREGVRLPHGLAALCAYVADGIEVEWRARGSGGGVVGSGVGAAGNAQAAAAVAAAAVVVGRISVPALSRIRRLSIPTAAGMATMADDTNSSGAGRGVSGQGWSGGGAGGQRRRQPRVRQRRQRSTETSHGDYDDDDANDNDGERWWWWWGTAAGASRSGRAPRTLKGLPGPPTSGPVFVLSDERAAGIGQVCLCYDGAAIASDDDEDGASDDDDKGMSASVWLRDTGGAWYPLARSFGAYFRAQVAALGVEGWQQAHSARGLAAGAADWLGFASPGRAAMYRRVRVTAAPEACGGGGCGDNGGGRYMIKESEGDDGKEGGGWRMGGGESGYGASGREARRFELEKVLELVREAGVGGGSSSSRSSSAADGATAMASAAVGLADVPTGRQRLTDLKPHCPDASVGFDHIVSRPGQAWVDSEQSEGEDTGAHRPNLLARQVAVIQLPSLVVLLKLVRLQLRVQKAEQPRGRAHSVTSHLGTNSTHFLPLPTLVAMPAEEDNATIRDASAEDATAAATARPDTAAESATAPVSSSGSGSSGSNSSPQPTKPSGSAGAEDVPVADDEDNGHKAKAAKKGKAEKGEKQAVGYAELFRFATPMDLLGIAIATVFSAGMGIMMPAAILILGSMLNSSTGLYAASSVISSGFTLPDNETQEYL
ncbi:hypothetical protein HK405_012300, partial [Cladochytrium tenue]